MTSACVLQMQIPMGQWSRREHYIDSGDWSDHQKDFMIHWGQGVVCLAFSYLLVLFLPNFDDKLINTVVTV